MTLVCGPPAAGKSRYVAEQAGATNIIIDLDEIVRELGIKPRGGSWWDRRRAIEERNRRLQALANESAAGAAWFITTAPTGMSRERWARLLRAKRVLLFLTPREISLARIDADADRRAERETQVAILDRWWRFYYPSRVDTVMEV